MHPTPDRLADVNIGARWHPRLPPPVPRL